MRRGGFRDFPSFPTLAAFELSTWTVEPLFPSMTLDGPALTPVLGRQRVRETVKNASFVNLVSMRNTALGSRFLPFSRPAWIVAQI